MARLVESDVIRTTSFREIEWVHTQPEPPIIVPDDITELSSDQLKAIILPREKPLVNLDSFARLINNVAHQLHDKIKLPSPSQIHLPANIRRAAISLTQINF